MASAGIPGMAGFIAEILVLQGSYATLTNTDLRSLYWSNSSVLRDSAQPYLFWQAGQRHSILSPSQIFRASPSFSLSSYHFLPGIQPTWLVRWSETTTNAMVAAVQVNSERQL